MTTPAPEPLSAEQAAEALRAAAFTTVPEDDQPARTLIHCFSGAIGADWNLAEALELVARADLILWHSRSHGHDLAVRVKDERFGGMKVYCFDVRRPESQPAPTAAADDAADAEAPGVEVPAHLQATRTDRGFAHMPTIRDEHGTGVRVYESSSADGPHIWLNAGTAHLTAESAWHLADQLRHLVVNHYQGDARPPTGDPDTVERRAAFVHAVRAFGAGCQRYGAAKATADGAEVPGISGLVKECDDAYDAALRAYDQGQEA